MPQLMPVVVVEELLVFSGRGFAVIDLTSDDEYFILGSREHDRSGVIWIFVNDVVWGIFWQRIVLSESLDCRRNPCPYLLLRYHGCPLFAYHSSTRRGLRIGIMTTEKNSFLRKRRMELHLTQQEVADRAGINIGQYQKLEYGKRDLWRASFYLASCVLMALEIDVSDYFHEVYTEINKGSGKEMAEMDSGTIKYYLLHFEVEEEYLSIVNKVLKAANLTFEEAFKTAVEYYVKHPDELKEAAEKCKGEPEIVTNARFIPVHEGETEAAAIEAAGIK